MNNYVVDCNVLRKNDRIRTEVDVFVVLESDYDAKCHASDVYFGSWKRAEEERDAAQIDLAALREDLAQSHAAHNVAAENHAALNTTIFQLEQRLIAAEQRNAVMTELLVACGLEFSTSEANAWEVMMREKINAVLSKPTESGASE